MSIVLTMICRREMVKNKDLLKWKRILLDLYQKNKQIIETVLSSAIEGGVDTFFGHFWY